jgi:hypothetical protein
MVKNWHDRGTSRAVLVDAGLYLLLFVLFLDLCPLLWAAFPLTLIPTPLSWLAGRQYGH